jgi:polysaccharide export outer membrane protein
MPVSPHDVFLRLFQRLLLLVLGSAAVLAVAGCTSSRGGSVPYEPKDFGRPDVESVAPPSGPQRIGPGDKVKISVFQVEDLSGEFQVDTAGNINFPLIGTVAAQGKTAAELSQAIGDRLEERYLQSPNVQVSLTETTAQTITVDGSVKQPGVFPVQGTTTLMKAIALARGTAEDANLSRVVIFRTINGERLAGAFDLQAIRRAQAADPVIYGNDIVIVDGSRARALFRDLMQTIPLLGVLRPF